MSETIADICAEKRRTAVEIEKSANGNPNQFQRELIADLRGEADRIEAAHEREMADALDTGAFVEAARKRECDAIERIVRDAIVAYDFDYPMAPNEDCERDLVARAKTANDWLVAHGYEAEELAHMEGGAK